MADGIGKTDWNQPGPASIPIPGAHEIGDRCPNCDFPIVDPKATIIARTPASASWTCPHCQWTMKTSRHEPAHNNRQPGGNLIARQW